MFCAPRESFKGSKSNTIFNDLNSFFFFSDYENFCQILLQRPFMWGSAGMLFTSRVTDDDLEIMTKLAQGHFEKVIIILKQLPRSMLLVFRCLYKMNAITL